jgi:hypothetical protein
MIDSFRPTHFSIAVGLFKQSRTAANIALRRFTLKARSRWYLQVFLDLFR